MKRPNPREERGASPMQRPNLDHDHDVTDQTPVVQAPSRSFSEHYSNDDENEAIDYGDYAQPIERGSRLRDFAEEEPRPTPPPAEPRKRPNADGSTMAEIQARIAKKREERKKRHGVSDDVQPMQRKEFAQPERQQTREEQRPPLVDRNLPSAALRQVPEHNVFPTGAYGEAPEGWVRHTLPSLGIPYDFDDVFARVLEVPDLLSIHAATQDGSYTMFLDALNNAINIDIRDLTGSDLRFMLYWWRINSFSRSPYTLTWTSRYGNENKTMITNESELETVELAMKLDDYHEFQSKGIDFPRVRDAEYLDDVTLNPTDRWMAERAQYVVTEETGERWYPSRLERLRAGGIEMFELIRDFSKQITHGVVERVTVEDKKYEPEAAMFGLRQQAQYIGRIARSAAPGELTVDTLTQMNARVDDYLDEADEIERILTNITLIKQGESPDGMNSEDLPSLEAALAPRKETITLRISALDFFPEI